MRRQLESLATRTHGALIPCADESRFEAALREARKYGALGGWAISENALRAFVWALRRIERPRIVEFGAGVSSVFLGAYYQDSAEIISFEHQPEYAARITAALRGGSGVRVEQTALYQFDDATVQRVLRGELDLPALYEKGVPLDPSRYGETRIPNLFYRVDALPSQIDAAIIDGPNGSGRSIAFGLLRSRLSNPAYLLVDDFNHYDFLHHCAQALPFNVLHGEVLPHERWVLLESGAESNPRSAWEP